MKDDAIFMTRTVYVYLAQLFSAFNTVLSFFPRESSCFFSVSALWSRTPLFRGFQNSKLARHASCCCCCCTRVAHFMSRGTVCLHRQVVFFQRQTSSELFGNLKLCVCVCTRIRALSVPPPPHDAFIFI